MNNLHEIIRNSTQLLYVHKNIIIIILRDIQKKMFLGWEIMDHYYFSNWFWITFNVILIIPFLISCVCRFLNQSLDKHLWTDHFARYLLLISWLYYIYDMVVKYPVDGAETICEKAFYIHHGSSLFILPPLILNKHIPWWVSPIGFMHGFCIKFP